MGNLAILRQAIPSAQVSSLTTGSITLPSARGAFTVPGDFVAISTVTLTANTSTITFSDIPSTYTHLQIRGITRSTRTADRGGSPGLYFNGDTNNNYSWHRLWGDTTSIGSDGSTSDSKVFGIGLATNAETANYMGSSIWDILDYTNTSKLKTTRWIGGLNNNRTTDTGYIGLCGGLWNSTAAITSITLLPNVNDWATSTTFALYGIKVS